MEQVLDTQTGEPGVRRSDQAFRSSLPDRLETGHPHDRVVLLDQDRSPCGSAPREDVHSADTPLHLAFSCYLIDEQGRVLLTRRALDKRSWPGVWTNSFCGHPRPGEPLVSAVERHGRGELGIQPASITPVLPDFAYRAVDASGILENEVCPVFTARALDHLDPHPAEVAELRWITIDELREAVRVAPWVFSPWLVVQVATIDEANAWHLLRHERTEVEP